MHESTSPKGVDMIQVRRTGEGDPLEFEVVVREGRGETRHHVTMARETCKRVTAGKHTPERCLVAALRFLLDRERKESILSRFDVTVISHDFPEFEQELPAPAVQTLGAGHRRGHPPKRAGEVPTCSPVSAPVRAVLRRGGDGLPAERQTFSAV